MARPETCCCVLIKVVRYFKFQIYKPKAKAAETELGPKFMCQFGKHQIDRSKGERRGMGDWGGHIVELAVLLICVGLLFVFGDFYLCFSSRFTVKLTAHLLCLLIGAYCFS